MALDQSQIAEWLLGLRGKTPRSVVAKGSGVSEKAIQRYEIEGVEPSAEAFLRLVTYYGAGRELATWLEAVAAKAIKSEPSTNSDGPEMYYGKEVTPRTRSAGTKRSRKPKEK